MNQEKIGSFLKGLRVEKKLTQEQLAEILNVSNRSISRWENGVNMPDFDLLIQIAEFFEVGIEEILDGERKSEEMNPQTKQTLLKVADYQNNEQMIVSKRLNFLFIIALIAFAIYMVIDIMGLAVKPVYDDMASFALGIVLGALLVGLLYTSKYFSRIRAFKLRLLKREKE